MSTFADLGVSKASADALARRGITKPFEVQSLVIADVLAGRDVLAQSPTGSGKTLAFGVPMLDRISAEDRRPAGLVLAPTRELACQIVDELESVAKARALSIAPVYGGVGIERQAKRAARAHVVVATPGRLEDLLARRAFTLDRIRVLVLDEADRMLDMGFKPPVDRIVAQIPKGRQTLFFSATLDGEAGKVARRYTRDARVHVHEPADRRRTDITHRFVMVEHAEKLEALVAQLEASDLDRALVFVRTKRGADRLVKRLGGRGHTAVAMHGDKSQAQRQKALARFERGDVATLVATDVAARGIDVAEISHVIQFDAPEDRDTYTHRVGRTGRAGSTGIGVSFVIPDQRGEMRIIARDLGLLHHFDEHEGGRGHSRSSRPNPARSGGASEGSPRASRPNRSGRARSARSRPR